MVEIVMPDIITPYGTVKSIIKKVCNCFEVSESEIKGRSRERDIVIPRQTVMYFLNVHCGLSSKALGRMFNRDHSTVLYSVNEIRNVEYKEAWLKPTFENLEKNILNG